MSQQRQLPHSLTSSFEAQVEILQASLKGTIGLCVRHLGTGEQFSVHGDERFPMASTYKIPIAAIALAGVDQGELQLGQMVEITPRHRDETGDIADSWIHPGISVSLANLIETMLVHSNNNATDRVLEVIGGPKAVTAWLRTSGIRDMRVDRSVNDLLNQFYHLPAGAAAMVGYLERWTTEDEKELVNGTPNPEFESGDQDTTTPSAMVALLAHLFAGGALTDASQSFLSGVMSRCKTGAGRLRGLLPLGTKVAHKTGSIGGTINDAGIVDLPESRGRVAIAVYTKESPNVPMAKRERVIAELSRSAYDYFALR